MAELEALVRELRAVVRELKARLGLNSRNSSKPPSSDPLDAQTRPAASKRSGRKPGGQPGHPGQTRRRFRPEEIDRSKALAVRRCHLCGGRVGPGLGERLEPRRHQVVEIPATAAFVTEYVCERRRCPSCGEVTTARLPEDLPHGATGPRLQAVSGLLVGRYRLSRRECCEALETLYGPKASLSVGMLSATEQRTETALAACCAEAVTAVRQSKVVHADETSFGKRPSKRWLWTACTETLSVFRIDDERSRRAFRKLLPSYDGVLVTDRYVAYDDHPSRLRQICWSHLQRDFAGLVDRGNPAAPVGHAGLRACKAVTGSWHRHQTGRLTRKGMAKRLRPTKQALQASLERSRNSPDRKARALCRNLLGRWDSLWTFTRRDGVPPTNNLAEREIRPAALWRKTSFGCRSIRGRRFAAAMMTVTRSLRAQQRSVLDFLVEAIAAYRCGRVGPSLVPG